METSAQVIALQDLGCEYAQGFLFARPLSPAQMRSFASRNLSLSCNAQGAMAYINQWNDRLIVFPAIEPIVRTDLRRYQPLISSVAGTDIGSSVVPQTLLAVTGDRMREMAGCRPNV